MRLTKFIFFFSLLVLASCQTDSLSNKSTSTKTNLHDLAINWELVKNGTNAEGQNRQTAILTIKNIGQAALANNWAIYFNQISGPVPGNATSGNVEMIHVNGDFYGVKPSDGFKLGVGEEITIEYQGANWATKKSDAPSGIYAVFVDGNGKELAPQPIKNYTISPFVKPEQLNRAAADKFPIPTNEYRYKENAKLTKLGKGELLPIIPSPVKATIGKGILELTNDFSIAYFGELQGEADFLVAQLEELGLEVKTYDGGTKGNKSILLSTVSTPIVGKSKEAYRLKVDPENETITIEGTDAAGVFYGIQSLMSLMPNEVYQQKNTRISFNELLVEDAPRFEYRGLMLDVSRNFHSKKLVKKLLTLMANYKLNKFHFHLTDDEGWRLEIPDLPELTEIGAKRGHTLDETDRLQPAYGSGPNMDAAAGTGYYTVADYIEILKFAQARHIEVIPEIDVPGHSRSCIIPMRVRHDRLIAAGKEVEAKQYLLNDENDKSEYRTAQSYNDNVINVCMESTYTFFEKVVDEIVEMHNMAGVPLKMLHTGGDEVPGGAWQKSPICADLVANNKGVEGDVVGMTNYFLKRLSKILAKKNLAVGGWEEIGLHLAGHGAPRRPNPEFVNDRFVPFVWNSIFGWGGEDIAYQLANLGYPVVLCNASNLYFDLSYDKDPENAGLYWAGYVNTRTAYDFVPFDLFKTAQMGRYGEKLDRAALAKGKAKLNSKAQKNVLGIQGQLWSETLISPERLELSTFPKLMGLAERAWAQQPAWATDADEDKRFTNLEKDWNQFTNTIGQKEMTRMDYLSGGVGYYIPPAGAKIEAGKLYANTAFPGLSIRYTIDGSEPTVTSQEYTEPIEVKGDVKLKVFSGGGNSSRTTIVKKDLVD